jgi:methylglutaconyl-CoA hydratase
VHIGFIPAIVMVFLIRKIGEARAKEMLLTGDLVSAHKAHSIGIINDVLPIETIENDVRNFALKLCKENSGASMELTKKMMADVQDLPIDDALLFAAKMNARSRATEDCRKGMSNFLQKLPLEW